METEYSNYVPQLINFWKHEIKDHIYKLKPIINKNAEPFLFLLKEAENGNLLDWLNTKDSFLAYIILMFYVSKMVYVKRKYYKNDLKVTLFMEMGIENYKSIMNQDEILTVCSPYLYSENYVNVEHAKNIIINVLDTRNNKIKICLYRIEKILNILKKFNRFPERNKYLNRESTEDEIDYLDTLDN